MKREMMGGPTTSAVFTATSILLVAFTACRSPSTMSDAPSAARSRRLGAEYERQARLGSQPRAQAESYLKASEIYIRLGLYPDAKRALNGARSAYYAGEIGSRTDRLLGEVFLETGEVILAERYLIKGLADAHGAERELALARLVLAARARGESRRAEGYAKRLREPRSPEVDAVLARKLEAPFAERENPPSADEAPERPSPRSPARPSAGPSSRRETGRRLTILPRWRWQARPALANTQPMRRIRKITVHHTGGEESFWGRTLYSAANEIRKIQRYHQRDQGWADIGYHFIIDRNGTIWQGRSLRYQGAHARHENPGNIGIAILGNYTRQHLTPEQKESLSRFLALLVKTYAVSPREVYTHHEILEGKTDCPGTEISDLVASIRGKLRSDVLAYRR